MIIEFVINPEYDKKFVIVMLKGRDWEYRAKNMGLDPDLVRKINSGTAEEFEKAEKELSTIIDDIYRSLGPFIEKACNEYQQSWDKIIDEFSDTVADTTVPWFYDKYIVNVTHFNRGLSNWNGNFVGRWWRENPDMQRRITAHEILLAHYFSIHRNLYKSSGLVDEQIWALAEIFAIAMTGLEPKISKFWPWDTKGYYIDHNYPMIVELQNALKKPFLNRKNFEEYVNTGVELAKRYYPQKK